jgi:hypothetical protein
LLHIRVLRPLTRAAALLAVSGAALTVPAAAGAATAGSTHPEPASYTCTLPGFGPVANVQADLNVPVTATTGQPAAVTLTVPAIPLPSAVGAQLDGVTSYSVSTTQAGEAPVSDATTDYLSFTGQAAFSGGIPAQIPAITASSSVTFVQPGYFSVSNLTEFTITPFRGGTALSAITCDTPFASEVGYPVTITAPGQPVYPGPEYSCSVNGDAGGKPSVIAFDLSVRGPRTVGSDVTVTLSSPASQGLGGPYAPPTTTLIFTGSLPVTGAQTGSVPLAKRTTDLASPTLQLSGPLLLARAGADRIHFPARFTFAQLMSGSQPDPIVMSCTMVATPAQTWITIQVTALPTTPATTPATSASAGAGGGSGGTAATGAVPAGAPSTGGGQRPGRDLPLAGAGVALLLLGGAALWYAARRRAVR